MQLVAYGAQDIYLTGNPQITFFKVVYRRHTNFSMESIKQTFNGSSGFGGDVSATISRNGDLVYRMYLEHKSTFTGLSGVDLSNVGLCERYGDSLIKECEIEIGGQKIDKHTSMWNRVYSDLTEYNPSGHFGAGTPPVEGAAATAGNGTLYQYMTGNTYSLTTAAALADADFAIGVTTVNGISCTATGTNSTTTGVMTVNPIFIPLNFWFCRNPGLALPLIALQYHEVKVKMTFESLLNLTRVYESNDTSTGAGLANVTQLTDSNVSATGFDLWCDYIYLDTDERRRFAQVSHEYLIEQLQYSDNTISSQSPSIDLNFNHPIKELIWCSRNTGTDGRSRGGAGGTTDPTAGPVSLDGMGGNWQLKLNGHDRFKERDTKYFTRTQVWQHHTGYGAIPTIGSNGAADLETTVLLAGIGGDSIAVYSFALKPEEHQPSGTCNFSRIDNAQLVGSSIVICDKDTAAVDEPPDGTANTLSLTVFAINYNVLRIMSGMGGLAYSN
jgi:hypothetical protein